MYSIKQNLNWPEIAIISYFLWTNLSYDDDDDDDDVDVHMHGRQKPNIIFKISI